MIIEQRVYFMIQTSDLSPEQITRHLGVEPTQTEVKESHRGSRSGRLIPPRHNWVMGSGLPETASLSEQTEAAMNHLAGTWDRIGELTTQGEDATLVMLRSFEHGPGFTSLGLALDGEAIGFLHRAGAHVWIDEYDCSED